MSSLPKPFLHQMHASAETEAEIEAKFKTMLNAMRVTGVPTQIELWMSVLTQSGPYEPPLYTEKKSEDIEITDEDEDADEDDDDDEINVEGLLKSLCVTDNLYLSIVPNKNAISLSAYGYENVLCRGAGDRRQALIRAVVTTSAERVLSKLAFLIEVRDDTDPTKAIFMEDFDWLIKTRR